MPRMCAERSSALSFGEAMLQGKHVRLEALSPSHVPGLVAAATSGGRETFGLTTVPADEAEARAYVELALSDAKMVPFATLRGDEVVGSTRFCNIERWDWRAGNPHRREIDAVEIGWTWLTPAAQRSAVNTEAKLLMLSHAFEVWRVHRVTLKTDERNARSRAAIERLGAKLDGILRAHMPAADGGIRASAVYSIVENEWPAVKARLEVRLAHPPGIAIKAK